MQEGRKGRVEPVGLQEQIEKARAAGEKNRRMFELGHQLAQGAEAQGWAELAAEIAETDPRSKLVDAVLDQFDKSKEAKFPNYSVHLFKYGLDAVGLDKLVEKFGQDHVVETLDYLCRSSDDPKYREALDRLESQQK